METRWAKMLPHMSPDHLYTPGALMGQSYRCYFPLPNVSSPICALMCYLCSLVMFDRLSKCSGRILEPGILEQRKHLASVLAVLSKLTDGTNTWTREKQSGRENETARKGRVVQSSAYWSSLGKNDFTQASLWIKLRENSSLQSFVFLNHTARCIFQRRPMMHVYVHICAAGVKRNMSIPHDYEQWTRGSLYAWKQKAVCQREGGLRTESDGENLLEVGLKDKGGALSRCGRG